MIALWMAYATLVAAALAGGAHAGEVALRLQRRQTRFLWGASLVASVTLPLVALAGRLGGTAMAGIRGPERSPPAVTAVLPTPSWLEALRLPPLLPGALPGWLKAADPLLLGAWSVASLCLLSLLAFGLWRMAAFCRRWPTARVDGEPVLISGAFGPAVVGVVRPDIVLPRWALWLEEGRLALVLRHEREHREERDTLLLGVGILAVLVTPWNPVLWWQLARLRLAVEMDCDQRVLAGGADRRRYGETLLEVAERMDRTTLWAPALSTPTSFLERRMSMIVRPPTPRRPSRTCAAALLAGLMIALACEIEPPTAPGPAPTAAPGEASLSAPGQDRHLRWKEAAPPAPGGSPRDAVDLLRELDTDRGTRHGDGPHLILREVAGAGKPLVFIDGERTGFDDFHMISPDEIERIEVLKARAAFERYGPEGSAGTVHLFRKRPAQGAGSPPGGA